MGFDFSDDIIAGAFSGVVARVISAPFDVIKIRSQLKADHVNNNSAASVMQSFKDIAKNEGFLASLWKGGFSVTIVYT